MAEVSIDISSFANKCDGQFVASVEESAVPEKGQKKKKKREEENAMVNKVQTCAMRRRERKACFMKKWVTSEEGREQQRSGMVPPLPVTAMSPGFIK